LFSGGREGCGTGPGVRDFAQDGLLEIGCIFCGRHGYWTKDQVKLPAHLTIAEAGMVLTCSNCGQKNKEVGYPLWVRPDGRGPVVGQLGLAHPPRIVFEGRNEIQQRKFLKMRVNAWMRPADWTDD
jgi:hypothetical protein